MGTRIDQNFHAEIRIVIGGQAGLVAAALILEITRVQRP
jgi:hypothetical protein